MDADGIAADDLIFGNMGLVTTITMCTVKPHWLRSGWWDFLQEFWDDLVDDGLLNDLGYDERNRQMATTGYRFARRGRYAYSPGETRSYPFWTDVAFPQPPQ